jgi:hypothetical protein
MEQPAKPAQGELVEQGEHIGGQLAHREHGSVGNEVESACRQIGTERGDTVTAQVGNHGANAREFLGQRTPVIAVERGGVQKDNRWAGACVGESKARAVRKRDAVHTPGGYIPGRGGVSSGIPIQAAR